MTKILMVLKDDDNHVKNDISNNIINDNDKRKNADNESFKKAYGVYYKFLNLLRKLKLFGRRTDKSTGTDSGMESVEEISLNDELKMYLLRINDPSCPNVKELIESICSREGIERCYFSRRLKENIGYENHTVGTESQKPGKILFYALTLEILKRFYAGRPNMNRLDIVVIEGSDRSEVINIIEMLSPITGFITVLAKDRTWLEKQVEEIYNDTGLSITIVTELNRCLRDSSIIINLGDTDDLCSWLKCDHQSIVLCYSPSFYDMCNKSYQGYIKESDLKKGSILISNIDLYIPLSIMVKIGKLVPRDFSSLEMAELLLQNQLNLFPDDIEDRNILKEMEKGYKENGYYIKGIIGTNI